MAACAVMGMPTPEWCGNSHHPFRVFRYVAGVPWYDASFPYPSYGQVVLTNVMIALYLPRTSPGKNSEAAYLSNVVRSYWWEPINGVRRLCDDRLPLFEWSGNGHYLFQVLRIHCWSFTVQCIVPPGPIRTSSRMHDYSYWREREAWSVYTAYGC